MKILMWTDIHWGAKGNSMIHNNDCLDFTRWMAAEAKKRNVDMMVFMGDWFENRSAIDILTLNASGDGLEIIEGLGIPTYKCVGNHDLKYRKNRSQFSVRLSGVHPNVNVISEITYKTIGGKKMAFVPYLFRHEYPDFAAEIVKQKPDYVFGHLEFKDFILTGSYYKLESGPDHTLFSYPKFVFSGHFHKRQIRDNIVFIGNPFGTNYGDAGDTNRGICILDTDTNTIEFVNWEDGPRYVYCRLSDLISDDFAGFAPKTHVSCLIDIDIDYSDAQVIREQFSKQYSLREFSLEENIIEKKNSLEHANDMVDLSSTVDTDDAIKMMIRTHVQKTATIDPEFLSSIYEGL